MIGLLFPGQGNENFCIEQDEANKYFFEKTKTITGIDLTKTDLDFSSTTSSQIQIFVSSIIKFSCYKKKCDNFDFCVAGLSLGEMSALCAAEVFSFEEGLEIVMQRGTFMDEACKKYEGGMMAVLGLDDAIIENFCGEGIWAANYNCNGQLVLSGYKDKLEAVKKKLIEVGARKVVDLNVQGAFHSPMMEEARIKFEKYLDKKIFHEPKYKLYQNTNALSQTDPELIKKNIVEQLVKPILWKQTMKNMKRNGIEEFIDFSEKEMLKKFLNRI